MSDSPRWCATCKAWGDHHTDRHFLYVLPEPDDLRKPTPEEDAELQSLVRDAKRHVRLDGGPL